MIDKGFMAVLLLECVRARQTVGRRSNEKFSQPLGGNLGRLQPQQTMKSCTAYLSAARISETRCGMIAGLACWIATNNQGMTHSSIPVQMD